MAKKDILKNGIQNRRKKKREEEEEEEYNYNKDDC
tara:strand:- start:386 stop:490 length:105 start_codon:yes stop_codon:yes gene_type:complete